MIISTLLIVYSKLIAHLLSPKKSPKIYNLCTHLLMQKIDKKFHLINNRQQMFFLTNKFEALFLRACFFFNSPTTKMFFFIPCLTTFFFIKYNLNLEFYLDFDCFEIALHFRNSQQFYIKISNEPQRTHHSD